MQLMESKQGAPKPLGHLDSFLIMDVTQSTRYLVRIFMLAQFRQVADDTSLLLSHALAYFSMHNNGKRELLMSCVQMLGSLVSQKVNSWLFY